MTGVDREVTLTMFVLRQICNDSGADIDTEPTWSMVRGVTYRICGRPLGELGWCLHPAGHRTGVAHRVRFWPCDAWRALAGPVSGEGSGDGG